MTVRMATSSNTGITTINTQGSSKGNGAASGEDLESRPLMRQKGEDGEFEDTRGITNR